MTKTVEKMPSLGFPLFETSLVTGSEIDALKLGIGKSYDDVCDPLAWINDARDFDYKLVSVKDGWSSLPTGFVSFDMFPRKELVGDEWVAKLGYNIHAVFVNPEFRGKGQGRALRRMMSDLIETNVQSVQERGFADKIEIFIEAECVTADGAAFVHSLVSDCEKMIDKMSERRSANDTFRIEFKDCVDYGDYENGAGFSSPAP